MTKDVVDLLIKMVEEQGKKIDNLDKKVNELVDLKNRIIAIGLVLSAIFALIWDLLKSLFWRN